MGKKYNATKGLIPGAKTNKVNGAVVTTKELAEQLGTRPNVVTENAKKCLPNKKIENGKATYWTKEEVTVLLEFMKTNNANQHNLSRSLIGASTDMTPALKLKMAMELAQEAYEEEIAHLRLCNENLCVQLDESKEWYSIKRMQKLNPSVVFDWRLMKRESEKLGHEVKKVFDQNYGEVNAYHRDVYESLYFDTLEY